MSLRCNTILGLLNPCLHDFSLQTQDLIHYIQDAFIGNLHNVTWMDDATKEAAEEKAYAIKPKIGFPDWIEDTVKLDEYFKDVSQRDGGPPSNLPLVDIPKILMVNSCIVHITLNS